MKASSVSDIIEEINKRFPDMSEKEIETEFLIQLWLASSDGLVVIAKAEDDDGEYDKYYFAGIEKDIPDGKTISPDEFYNETLVNVLINAIDNGFVYVVDTSGDGDYGFLNSHEIDEDDFFLYSLPKERAIEFAQGLVDDEDTI